jgi:hypothetical protein
MEFGNILDVIIKNGGPAMTVAVAFILYMYRDVQGKNEEIERIRNENRDLVSQLIEDKEKRLMSDAQNMSLLEKVLERSGTHSLAMREAFQRVTKDVQDVLGEVRALKDRVS